MNQNTYPVQLITLDPGHFHAGLVQKKMYHQISPEVYVYAPEGEDVNMHLQRINSFNKRENNPTSWKEVVYTGSDFFEKMLSEKKGNVVMISGNNERKTEYIQKSIESGFHVLADKPMAINSVDFQNLLTAFSLAEEKGLFLYDIMTERYEITTILQKELSGDQEIFGEFEKGTPGDPSVTKESVHHFFKYVSGEPLIRPAWFFDVEQQGEGIVDVSTHLVDLIQWACFPEEIINRNSDIKMISADRWATELTPEQFQKVTGLAEYPDYLLKDVNNNTLHVYSNGQFTYKIRNLHAKVSVIWNFQAPEGAGDTHYSIMKGTNANLIISQQEEENYVPTLYVEKKIDNPYFDEMLRETVEVRYADEFPGLKVEKISDDKWRINIPDRYRVGHEAHFGQVVDHFLEFFEKGKMPEWEVPNMITKYYVTTAALDMALENDQK